MSQRRRGSESRLSSCLNFWVIGGAVIIATFLSISTLGLLWLTRPGPVPRGSSTAILSVIRLPATPPLPGTPTPPSNPTLDPAGLPSPPPGVITIGEFVQITGTGGDGLRLRSEPGFDSQVLVLGNEAEVFHVEDGPKDLDGYSWWYIVGQSDNKRRGWAVSNYLSPVQNP